jgi:hypothetical protein
MELAIIIGAPLGVFFLLLLGLVIRNDKKQQQLVKEQQSHIDSLVKQNGIARNEIAELRATLVSMSKRFHSLESGINNLQEQQQQLKFADPESKLYSRAIKMIELGAELEEVMRECEIPRAEAELLFNLHHKA